jgi:hypothetical protein
MNLKNQETEVALYNLSFELRGEYLYAYVEGPEDSLEISRSFWFKILRKCREHNLRKVLVEENLAENTSSAEAYNLVNEMATWGFGNILVAFVDRQLEHQKINRFGELVACNRGLRVRVFDSVNDAEKWLLSQ